MPPSFFALKNNATARAAAHFLATLSIFVGIGLIAGAIVKYPTHPLRFTTLGIIGVATFLIASFLEEYYTSHRPFFEKQGLKRFAGTFTFSAGIGLLCASIQDFNKIPHHTLYTVPLAVSLAFVGFILKRLQNKERHSLAILSLFGLTCVLLAWGVVYLLIYVINLE